jgi:hypothetical protein
VSAEVEAEAEADVGFLEQGEVVLVENEAKKSDSRLVNGEGLVAIASGGM